MRGKSQEQPNMGFFGLEEAEYLMVEQREKVQDGVYVHAGLETPCLEPLYNLVFIASASNDYVFCVLDLDFCTGGLARGGLEKGRAKVLCQSLCDGNQCQMWLQGDVKGECGRQLT